MKFQVGQLGAILTPPSLLSTFSVAAHYKASQKTIGYEDDTLGVLQESIDNITRSDGDAQKEEALKHAIINFTKSLALHLHVLALPPSG